VCFVSLLCILEDCLGVFAMILCFGCVLRYYLLFEVVLLCLLCGLFFFCVWMCVFV